MASSHSCVLREWAPVTELLNKLPTKQTLSIFSGDVKITCVDILPDFIALGTNYGVAYWYDRKKSEMQRLGCENPNVPITCIKVLCSVEYMLACGNRLGNISIFQIPKKCPEGIPDNLKPKNTKVELYTVSELHETQITALEWSKNGMKLFSGDKNGTVVLTEIDFYMHICKSLEILNESYQVVQLSYNNPKLVVSTLYRSIICEKNVEWNVVQIGQKDRKILGMFGGIIQRNSLKLTEFCVYCTRPGLRIWVSDSAGNVQKTLLFKDFLSKPCTEVPLLNPLNKTTKQTIQREVNFGKIQRFQDDLIVTYNESEVYILDPIKMELISKITKLRGVLDVSCYKNEIFVLETERSLIRISTEPDYTNNSTFKSSPQLETYINEHTDDEIVVNAEEATETTEINNKFENIKLEEYSSNDIIFKEKRKKKKKKDNDEFNITKPSLMNLSMVGIEELHHPDLRSPQTIQSDIENKEKILADVLQFDKKLERAAVITEKQKFPNVSNNKITRQKTMDEISSKIPINSSENSSSQAIACIRIPNEWSLTPLELKSSSENPRLSLDISSDWEFL